MPKVSQGVLTPTFSSARQDGVAIHQASPPPAAAQRHLAPVVALSDRQFGDHIRVWCQNADALAVRTLLSDVNIFWATKLTHERKSEGISETELRHKWLNGCTLAWFDDRGRFAGLA